MLTQSGKMGEGARKFRLNLGMENWGEAFLLDLLYALLLVEEQTQFGNEADVREREAVTDQELAVRR